MSDLPSTHSRPTTHDQRRAADASRLVAHAEINRAVRLRDGSEKQPLSARTALAIVALRDVHFYSDAASYRARLLNAVRGGEPLPVPEIPGAAAGPSIERLASYVRAAAAEVRRLLDEKDAEEHVERLARWFEKVLPAARVHGLADELDRDLDAFSLDLHELLVGWLPDVEPWDRKRITVHVAEVLGLDDPPEHEDPAEHDEMRVRRLDKRIERRANRQK